MSTSTDRMSRPSAPPSIPIAVATPVDVEADERDAANEAAAAEARERGTEMIRDHLDSHLTLNPGSSYVTWIAALHPENATVAIDPRFLTPGNPWLTVYQEGKYDLRKGEESAVVTVDAAAEDSGAPLSGVTEEPDSAYGGFMDLVLGFTILILAISVAFSVELIGLYCYASAVVCFKIFKACSDPRVSTLTALPFAICWLLYHVFRFLDVMLLFVSVMMVEVVAGINFLVCSLFSLDRQVGRSAHQRTRRFAHLTRWAFRRRFEWEPKRSTCGCRKCGEAVELVTTPYGDGEEKAPVPATVAHIPEKEELYDS
uniref:Uncharacterized protein n=1 Tax=Odontella aurita TaxID=265563 RepID=A0A7S4JRK4_9STRA